MTIQTKPTLCQGVTFRSRLEARWAVFFTSCGLRWEYEPEGFDTDHGAYLPDFCVNGQLIEIKPMVRLDEVSLGMARLREIQREFGYSLWILYGEPKEGGYLLQIVQAVESTTCEMLCIFAQCRGCGRLSYGDLTLSAWGTVGHHPGCDTDRQPVIGTEWMQRAYKAAMSERFGERKQENPTGQPPPRLGGGSVAPGCCVSDSEKGK